MAAEADSEPPPITIPPSKVVLVDDDPHALRALERSLRGSFAVVSYPSAELAVQHVQQGGVAVVVSDVSMAGMSGLDLLRAIRAHDPDLPVLLITGVPTLESAMQSIEYGVFRYLEKPFDPDELCKAVEKASRLYRIARMKRAALELEGATPGASDRVGLEVTFRRAMETLWIAFQPIVSVSSRSVFGYEALLRSSDPALPNPPHVLAAAEKLGALEELGRHLRRLVVEAINANIGDALLFLNLHPQDLLDSDLTSPDSALATMAPRTILEITERSSLGGLRDVQQRISALRALGFRIAIDDLGAGYAGLTSFALLEPDIVKIDMTLTRGIDKNPVKQKLVASLAALSREMSMTIVTEGVETREECQTLVELRCDLLQGYYFARPDRPFPKVHWR